MCDSAPQPILFLISRSLLLSRLGGGCMLSHPDASHLSASAVLWRNYTQFASLAAALGPAEEAQLPALQGDGGPGWGPHGLGLVAALEVWLGRAAPAAPAAALAFLYILTGL